MEERQAALDSRGAASGKQLQGFLDAIQQKIGKPPPSSGGEEDTPVADCCAGEACEETWRRNLFSSPKRKLQERWEQLSPSLRDRLNKYSPRKLRDYFAEADSRENVVDMEECERVSMGGAKMLAERQSRYKQIAAFYLESNPIVSSQSPGLYGQTESYLSDSKPCQSSQRMHENVVIDQFTHCDSGPIDNAPIVENLTATTSLIVQNTNVLSEDNNTEVDSLTLGSRDVAVDSIAPNFKATQFSKTDNNCQEVERSVSEDRNIYYADWDLGTVNVAVDSTDFAPILRTGDVEELSSAQADLEIAEIEKSACDIEEELTHQKLRSKDVEDSSQDTVVYTALPATVAEVLEVAEIEKSVFDVDDKSLNRSKEIDAQLVDCSCISKTESAPPKPKMPMGTPSIILQSPEMTLRRPTTLLTDSLSAAEVDTMQKRKSPLTVQEWVDHLPVKPKVMEDKLDDLCEPLSTLRFSAASRLSREASVQSSSSLDSLLDSRRPDPVEVLLNLGFGGVPGIDLENCRIPKRFLQPSKCKGGDWDEFIRRELLQVQNFECAALGFRGLSGPSHQRPSAIVANIMEKLRERSAPRPPAARGRFTSVARRVLSETSVLNKLTPLTTQSSANSVLTPDNRKFLESQGKISPEVPRRRIIFGQKSFAIDKDGEFVELEPNDVPSSSWSEPEDMKIELQPSSADLLRMRRSSLQRQCKVEEDEDEELSPRFRRRCASVSSLHHVPEDTPDIREELAAEIETLARKIQNIPREDLAAILEPIKELSVKLDDL